MLIRITDKEILLLDGKVSRRIPVQAESKFILEAKYLASHSSELQRFDRNIDAIRIDIEKELKNPQTPVTTEVIEENLEECKLNKVKGITGVSCECPKCFPEKYRD